MYVAPAETIDTVNISTNNFDAEQGMAGGAAITVITKSGTNNFKGSAFEFYNNEKLNASPYYFGDAGGQAGQAAGQRATSSAARWAARSRRTSCSSSARSKATSRPQTVSTSSSTCRRGACALATSAARSTPTAQPAGHLRPGHRQPGNRHGPHAVPEQHHSGRTPQLDLASIAGPVPDAEHRRLRRRRLTNNYFQPEERARPTAITTTAR